MRKMMLVAAAAAACAAMPAAGWTTFDPKAPPYKPSENEIERIRRARAA